MGSITATKVVQKTLFLAYIFRLSFFHFLSFENRGIFSKVASPKMLKFHRHRLCLVIKVVKIHYLFDVMDYT